MNKKVVRIGGGSAYERDILEPAVVLAERGNLDYLCFDTLAERTLALAQARRNADSTQGYNPLTEKRMKAVLPACVKNGVKIIGNFGAANPKAATDIVIKVIGELGFSGLKIATVLGDDVRHLVTPDLEVWETGGTVGELKGNVVSANAYIGADPIVAGLKEGADIVVTGRSADPSLWLAPLIYEFGWKKDDWDLKAAGIIAGHLSECSFQSTGGNYLDPGYTEDVPGYANIGYPIAEVSANGEMVLTKVEGTGGIVTPNSTKVQLVYEIQDPANYLTPDVIVDIRNVKIEQVGKDRVKISGVRGKERPRTLKVQLGVPEGYIAEAIMTWGGPGSYEKAKYVVENVLKSWLPKIQGISDSRYDYIGVNSIHGPASSELKASPPEVWLRCAARAQSLDAGNEFCDEVIVGSLLPAGSGGLRRDVRPVLAVYSTLIPREKIPTKVIVQDIMIKEVKG